MRNGLLRFVRVIEATRLPTSKSDRDASSKIVNRRTVCGQPRPLKAATLPDHSTPAILCPVPVRSTLRVIPRNRLAGQVHALQARRRRVGHPAQRVGVGGCTSALPHLLLNRGHRRLNALRVRPAGITRGAFTRGAHRGPSRRTEPPIAGECAQIRASPPARRADQLGETAPAPLPGSPEFSPER